MSIKIIALLGLFFAINCAFRATKVTVVGAGNVGATAANVLAINEVAAEVVLSNGYYANSTTCWI